MGRNAQKRRAAKAARRSGGTPAHPLVPPATPHNRAPRAHLSLPDYLTTHWPLSRRQAVEKLLGGKVNVNGSVWAYPEVPIDVLQINDEGHYRIMVEGMPDPRPPKVVLLGTKYKRKGT
jgi:hypothetical protein